MSRKGSLDNLRDSIARVGEQQAQRDRDHDPDRFDHVAYRLAFEAELAQRGREDMQQYVESIVAQPGDGKAAQ